MVSLGRSRASVANAVAGAIGAVSLAGDFCVGCVGTARDTATYGWLGRSPVAWGCTVSVVPRSFRGGGLVVSPRKEIFGWVILAGVVDFVVVFEAGLSSGVGRIRESPHRSCVLAIGSGELCGDAGGIAARDYPNWW